MEKNIVQRMKLNEEALSWYYMEERRKRYEEAIPLKGISLRQFIHPLPYAMVMLDRKLSSKEEVETISDERKLTRNPKIYVCTHIGGNDIQRVFESIKSHAYLFLGDPKGLYKDISGALLFCNGTINFETCNKIDRIIAYQRAVELLSNHASLLIFPEGAWNITPNLPVMQLYMGAISMAKKTNADIVPVAIEQYDNKFMVSIGKNIQMKDVRDLSYDELKIKVRDAMATEKWKIIEKNPEKRENITITDDEFAQSVVEKCPYGFTVLDVEKTRYKDKDIVIEEDVFRPIDNIKVNCSNAFVYARTSNACKKR